VITGATPASGSTLGGTTVTISGVALGSGSDITAVLFGSSAATIVSQTAASVVVTAPARAAGVSAITVRSTSRGEITQSSLFTYVTPQRMLLLCFLVSSSSLMRAQLAICRA
jgi:hypothetical protein